MAINPKMALSPQSPAKQKCTDRQKHWYSFPWCRHLRWSVRKHRGKKLSGLRKCRRDLNWKLWQCGGLWKRSERQCRRNFGFQTSGPSKIRRSQTRIFDNDIIDNNHENFAIALGKEPNGNTMTMIPPGWGVVCLDAKEVEVFNNRIHRNKTLGVAIANYQITGFPSEAPNCFLFYYRYLRSRQWIL